MLIAAGDFVGIKTGAAYRIVPTLAKDAKSGALISLAVPAKSEGVSHPHSENLKAQSPLA